MVVGIATFFATRHPLLALEAGEATLAAVGGAAVGGLAVICGKAGIIWITEENKDKKESKNDSVSDLRKNKFDIFN